MARHPQVQQLVDDDLLAEVGGLGKKAGVEGDTACGGAASPLAGHGADVDLLRFVHGLPPRHLVAPFRICRCHAAQFRQSSSACSRTVCVAFSCLSGGYPYFRSNRLTMVRILARALSFTAQSMVTLFRTDSTSSRAIVRRVSSPRTLTALSLTSRAS